jgi:hypothetical protein
MLCSKAKGLLVLLNCGQRTKQKPLKNMNTRLLLPITVGSFLAMVSLGFSQDEQAKRPAAAKTSNEVKKSEGANSTKSAGTSQSDLASKTVTFETVKKDSESVTNAVEAHDFTKAKEQIDKKGALRGTVTKIFEPRGNSMAIINFDAKYQSALTAVVRKADFSKFPDLKKLVGKSVVISGKFIEYQGRPEIILTNPEQLKLVE